VKGLHVDLHLAQRAKHPPAPCGDVIVQHRDQRGTTLILADGMGHGHPAFVAATMHAARLRADLERGRSLREAFAAVCDSIQAARGHDPVWAAMAVVRIRHDGTVTALTHEAPPPILLGPRQAELLPSRPVDCGRALVYETLGTLRAGEGLLLVSDGISQAGLGHGLALGLGLTGVADQATRWLQTGCPLRALPERFLNWLRSFPGGQDDDCSAVVAACRPGRCVSLLTGPPLHEADDETVVQRFLASPGLHIVCGDTTAAVVARETGQDLHIDHGSAGPFVPPMSLLDGIDIVTEGAITLTQVVNLLGQDLAGWREQHGVAQVVKHLHAADRVYLFHGQADNRAKTDLAFRQHGVLARAEAVRLIRDKLAAQGKYVLVEMV
jgi:hypothetical protein